MKSDSRPSSDLFSQRKKDHIEISLQDESQAFVDQFSSLQLQHQALPEIDFEEVSLDTQVFGSQLKSPLFVSSMTLGHEGAQSVNHVILQSCQSQGWMMGVGSQRRQLFDVEAHKECEDLRRSFPEVVLFGNLGLSQIIQTPLEQVEALVSSLGAQFMVVHTNPLQEVIQPEGTPNFKGGLKALTTLCEKLSVPVVLKETGCGFSQQTFERLKESGVAAIDVSGRGGTHWGRVEGLRSNLEHRSFKTAKTFADWGISTVDSLENGLKRNISVPLWASGGVRSGVDAAKLLALGAEKVGLAQPVLKAALQGSDCLLEQMKQWDHELKVAMFCMGIKDINELVGKRELVKWI